MLDLAHGHAGIAGRDGLDTHLTTIASTNVPAGPRSTARDGDFLNSFFLDDLALVRDRLADDDVGTALAAYLAADEALPVRDRIDVIAEPSVVDAGVAIERLPLGRWPARPDHPLASSQQFAVNSALADLGPAAGMLGINGPPGTGKTTMLRDILAGNVVERARRLATLERPGDAFTAVTHRWTASDGHDRAVRHLRPELTGFEMVLASANNMAVENVSIEIPARKAIAEPWRDSADYFGDIASELVSRKPGDCAVGLSEPSRSWGVIAAKLGNRGNRNGFRSAFWFDSTRSAPTSDQADRGVPRMQSRLTRWRDGADPVRAWSDARDDFLAAEARVRTLIAERVEARDRLLLLPDREADHERSARCARTRQRELTDTIADLASQFANERRADVERTDARLRRLRHLSTAPPPWRRIAFLSSTMRDWRAGLRPRSRSRRAARRHRRRVSAVGRRLRAQLTHARLLVDSADRDLAAARDAELESRRRCEQDRARFGDSYPDVQRSGELRELHAPWLDRELETARADLFLAALRLHQDFLANTAGDMLRGLRAAMDVVAGRHPDALSE
ncbi:MAG: hypothetical protein ACRCTI_11520, partial [Beijerinckiaceae bacterium]